MSQRHRHRKPRGQAIDGWLIVDKPSGIGSTEVVNRVKRAFDAQKAGHGGTLDPLATGVLPIAIGEATKLAGASGTKGEWDVAKADELLAKIDEIAAIFAETKKA